MKHFFEKLFCAVKFIVAYCKIHEIGYKDVVICNHIGDFIFTLGYIEEYKQENNITKLKITCAKRLVSIANYYENIGIVKASKDELIDDIREFYHFKSGRFFIKKILKIIVVEPAYEYHGGFEAMISNEKMTLKRTICKDVLHICCEEKYVNPFRKKTLNDCHDNKVLICPSATLIDDSSNYILNDVAEQIHRKGYVVKYNGSSKEHINTLSEIVEESCQYKAVIGIRSGLLDLLSLCGCNTLAIYPPKYELTHYFSLLANNDTDKKLGDYILTEDKFCDIDSILSWLERL